MYNFKEIEKKWQNYWTKNKTFEASNDSSKEKFYYLVEFPYPSGSGLHVGHVMGCIWSSCRTIRNKESYSSISCGKRKY